MTRGRGRPAHPKTSAILALAEQGFSTPEIVQALGVSRNTVKDMLRRKGWAWTGERWEKKVKPGVNNPCTPG